MPAHKRPRKTRQAYKFMEVRRNEFSMQALCRIPGVARARYYAWLHHPLSDRDLEDARLLRLIRTSFTASHGIHGAPRGLLDPREVGETCSKLRVERLMRENGVRSLQGYRTRHMPVAKPMIHRELELDASHDPVGISLWGGVEPIPLGSRTQTCARKVGAQAPPGHGLQDGQAPPKGYAQMEQEAQSNRAPPARGSIHAIAIERAARRAFAERSR
jgi:hypothetical protein